jgi:hypothetical protein
VTEMPTVKEDGSRTCAPAAAVPETAAGSVVLFCTWPLESAPQVNQQQEHQSRTGARTPSRNYYDDSPLPSGAATPTYRPKVSIDEPIPDGAGSKRLFKLSKRFSM